MLSPRLALSSTSSALANEAHDRHAALLALTMPPFVLRHPRALQNHNSLAAKYSGQPQFGWPLSYTGLLFFPAYAFELAAVDFSVHDATVWTTLIPDLVIRILELRSIPDCAVSMSVARRWISSHFIYLLSEWRLCVMKLTRPVADPCRSARRTFHRIHSLYFATWPVGF